MQEQRSVEVVRSMSEWAKVCWGANDLILWKLPVVPARGGAEVALRIYKNFLIYRTCMRRACVHSAEAVSCFTCPMWSSTSHFALHTSLFTLHSSHSTLHTSHSTLHSSHSTLHTSHCTLHTSQSTLHTSHLSLLSSHSTLHTSHSTLHTALFTPHTWHCILHTPRFISSELFSPYPSSSLLISSLLKLPKRIVLRMQPRHEATLTQPLQCDLQRLSCKTQ